MYTFLVGQRFKTHARLRPTKEVYMSTLTNTLGSISPTSLSECDKLFNLGISAYEASISALDTKLNEISSDLANVIAEISAVQNDIISNGNEMIKLAKLIEGTVGLSKDELLRLMDKEKQLRDKEMQLRDKEKQLRDEKMKLLDKDEQLREEKKLLSMQLQAVLSERIPGEFKYTSHHSVYIFYYILI